MVSRCACFCSVLLSIWVNYGANAALIPHSLNNTENRPLALCTGSHDWVGSGYLRQDCIKAIDDMWTKDAMPRGSQEYEFLSRGVKRKTSLPTVLLPRKYDSGVCLLMSVVP